VALFERAREAPEGERDRIIEAAEVPDSVREEVRSMLRFDDSEDPLFEGAGSALPSQIGPYSVIREIGAGGMGAVYLAEQASPHRRVAVKVIHPAFGSEETARRLMNEAEVLGRLAHPAIAQVYEAGRYEVGGRSLPYIAMEYVEGVPITEYVERERPSTKRRLELIAAICDAVQHAHEKDILHRDLKPGNILVTAEGKPKVLDFGLARVTDKAAAAVSLVTRPGALIGTVPYMSPEQASGEGERVGPASDVYALGVIAYELLTGAMPYAVRGRRVHEAIRVIQEDSPEPASSSDRSLRGDITTILGRALEKEPERRYQSAEAFAEDIRRHLSAKPIRARRPGAMYQLAKFCKRNKAIAYSVAAVFLILASATVVSSVAAVRATEAEASAIEQAELAREAEAWALRQTEIAAAVNSFLNDELLAAADPWSGGDPEATIGEILDRAIVGLADGYDGPPEVEARVRLTLSATLSNIGRSVEAEAQARAAAELYEAGAAGEPAPGEARLILAHALTEQSRFSEAAEIMEAVYSTRVRELGPEHEHTIVAATDYATALTDIGESEAAIELVEEVLPVAEATLGEDNEQVAVLHWVRGSGLYKTGRGDEAIPDFRKMLEINEAVYGREHPETSSAMASLAVVLQASGELEEAERYHREVIARDSETLGPTHPYVLTNRSNYALYLMYADRFEDAIEEHKKILDIRIEALGPQHSDTGVSKFMLAQCYQKTERYEEALEYAQLAYDCFAPNLGADHPYTQRAVRVAREVCEAVGDTEGAAMWAARAGVG